MTDLHFPAVKEPWRGVPIIAAIVLVALLAIALPFASTQLPEIPAFFPAFGTFFMLAEGITGFLLVAQFSRTKILADGLLGAAYGFTGFLVIVQTVSFPGVLSQGSLFDHPMQASAWLWVAWHLGYPLFVLAAMFAYRYRGDRPVAPHNYRLASIGTIVFPAVLGWGISWICISNAGWLPTILKPGTYFQLTPHVVIKATWLLTVIALFAVVVWGRGKSVMHKWLAIAVLASLADITLTIAGGTRFSIGWYTARLFSMVSATAVLGALLWEISQLYGAIQRANVQLSVWALQDGLTGLYNRRFFDVSLPPLITAAAHTKGNVSVLLMDVDYFKDYNDTLGHVEGDQCLQKVAHALSCIQLQSGDFVARYGGEEFVAVLRNATEETALQIGEEIRLAIENMRLPSPSPRSSTGNVTVSIGLASTRGQKIDAAKLVQAADDALYTAKETGRNCVVPGVL